MTENDIPIMVSIKKMVNIYGLEKTWELIENMYPDINRFHMRILYKSIYKLEIK